MSDKIYSRPRIKVKFFHNMNKKQKLKAMINIILILFGLVIIIFIKAAYPIFVASCENAASSTATNILNKEVNEVMLIYNYDDLVTLGKDKARKYFIHRS